jgi:hypothetical protein
MVIIPLAADFGRKSGTEQRQAVAALQYAATEAGLAGRVAVVWPEGSRMGFIAPQPWHPFFKSPGIYNLVLRNINRELIVPD